MTRKLIFLPLVLIGILGLVAARRQTRTPLAPSEQVRRTPVVVELFTSEGCSSCPPADRVLAELAAKQSVPTAEIIALEEHVDYWNQLGWIDPFSSQQATMRQLAYAGALGNENAYTPQMIVDGGAEFVGSRKGTAERAIERAAAEPKVDVEVLPAAGPGGAVRKFQIRVGKLGAQARTDSRVWLAVTEFGLLSDVSRGENAGHTLYHGPVVRSLTDLGSAAATGDTSFEANREVRAESRWKIENLSVVVFVQESRTKHILGASQVRFVE